MLSSSSSYLVPVVVTISHDALYLEAEGGTTFCPLNHVILNWTLMMPKVTVKVNK